MLNTSDVAPYCIILVKAVSPKLFLAFTSAPASIKAFITSASHQCAQNKGVSLSLSVAFTDKLSQRDELISSGLLKKQDNHYVLQENKLFSSVSSAASIVLGRRANGWLEWKNSDGKTLNELERRNS